jgi:hypothetical protein
MLCVTLPFRLITLGLVSKQNTSEQLTMQFVTNETSKSLCLRKQLIKAALITRVRLYLASVVVDRASKRRESAHGGKKSRGTNVLDKEREM